MSAETARLLEELREGLAAARRALDRLEDRLGDLEEGLRSDAVPTEHRDTGTASFQAPREAYDAGASPPYPALNEAPDPPRSYGLPAEALVGDHAGTEPDLAEFSLGMADEVPAFPPAAPVFEAPSHEDPLPGAAVSASFDHDDLLKDLFAGTPPRPAAYSVSAEPSGSFAESPSRDAAPQAIPSDDALEAILKSVHAPADEGGGLSPGGARSSGRERGAGPAVEERARASMPGEPRVDFSTDELEELLGPDRR